MRLIDVEAFIREIRKIYCEDCARRKGGKNGKMRFCYEIGGVPCRACDIEDVLDALDDYAPIVQPEPKRGKWLPDNNNYIYEQYVCSECKNSFKVDTCMGKPMWNFCPYCGARMER